MAIVRMAEQSERQAAAFERMATDLCDAAAKYDKEVAP